MSSCAEDYPCPIGEVCIDGLCTAGDGAAVIDSGSADATNDTWRRDVGGDVDDAKDAPDAPVDANPSDDAGDTGNTGDTGDARDAGADVVVCPDGRTPQPEICDGLDNDCDGAIDEDAERVGESCDTGQVGVCGQGVRVCNRGQLECEQTGGSSPEVCNGQDDDCDGDIDEQAAEVGDACQTGRPGICADGEKHCQFGQLVCKPILGPISEVCDGEDDDCDGLVDETFPQHGEACVTGQVGQCADGGKQCVGGRVVCEPVTPASQETCDGVDNDCDGLADEDASGMVLAVSCGAVSCPGRGVSRCVGAQWTPCREDTYEICDGADSNCDSQVDNQTPCYRVCPGGDVAVGTLDCSTIPASCKLPQEICNDGVDNNCDGQVDENCSGGNVRDGMVFVPGGPFWMGSQITDWEHQQDETPQHLVELSSFYIDQAEVTRGQYRDCWAGGGCSLPQLSCPYQGAGSTTNRLEKPIGCVTYDQALDYCQWAGKRLPTAAEWEKAARGPYPRQNLFPWGDARDATLAVVDCPNGLNDCTAETLSYPGGASYYGALHMSGNVAEWVTDYYDPNFYTSTYTVAPEQTTDAGHGHEVRGGSYDQSLSVARVSNRAALTSATVVEDVMGIRCALDAP